MNNTTRPTENVLRDLIETQAELIKKLEQQIELYKGLVETEKTKNNTLEQYIMAITR